MVNLLSRTIWTIVANLLSFNETLIGRHQRSRKTYARSSKWRKTPFTLIVFLYISAYKWNNSPLEPMEPRRWESTKLFNRSLASKPLLSFHVHVPLHESTNHKIYVCENYPRTLTPSLRFWCQHQLFLGLFLNSFPKPSLSLSLCF